MRRPLGESIRFGVFKRSIEGQRRLNRQGGDGTGRKQAREFGGTDKSVNLSKRPFAECAILCLRRESVGWYPEDGAFISRRSLCPEVVSRIPDEVEGAFI